MAPSKLRQLIFNLHTRKFGSVGEKLLEKLLQELGFVVDKAKSIHYDRQVNKKEDEFKCSRVLSKSTLNLNNGNIIEILERHDTERYVNLEDCENHEWDSNIQQIKKDCFDSLWYCLFFGDKVVVFKIDSNQISEDDKISYSDKQHKGNVGEGQFHITNKNIKYHMGTYLIKVLTYDEVYNKLNKN
jgi:hypothetical protein